MLIAEISEDYKPYWLEHMYFEPAYSCIGGFFRADDSRKFVFIIILFLHTVASIVNDTYKYSADVNSLEFSVSIRQETPLLSRVSNYYANCLKQSRCISLHYLSALSNVTRKSLQAICFEVG